MEPDVREADAHTTAANAANAAARRPPPGYVYIAPGTFTMGSPDVRPSLAAFERAHEVTLTHGFFMQVTEVTQGEWTALMGTNPSRHTGCGARCPVETVSWWDAAAYCNALSRSEGREACYDLVECSGKPGDKKAPYRCKGATVRGAACHGYRLPTEAEWEFAARAGTRAATYAGTLVLKGKFDIPVLDAIAWYGGNSGVIYGSEQGAFECGDYHPGMQHPATYCGLHPVGLKTPNPWGLYDMLGNVGEWSEDFLGPYAEGATRDPTGPATGTLRVLRGGSYVAGENVRAASRGAADPGSRGDGDGIRVVRSVP